MQFGNQLMIQRIALLRPVEQDAPNPVFNVIPDCLVGAQSFSSLAMISFMISDVPAPIVLSRMSRHVRPIAYSVV